MHKVLKIVVLIFFFPLLLPAQAPVQNKYAVLLGINDYYMKPGVKHPSSLHGCVNDANSIKELLINRFGFQSENIQTLFNENVTRKNVIDLMEQTLQKCKPGDAFVFFYSGHGAWMLNPSNKFDSVKRGMSQSMVMSDLYSPNLDCLFTDEVLKQVFNQFVDKKVIVTSLFDCCYSGNLAMGYDAFYWMPLLKPENKGLLLMGIYYVPEKKEPKGCTVDGMGHIIDTIDSDHDGIPDCKDWEIDSPPFMQVDSLGVSVEGVSAEDFINMDDKFESKTSAVQQENGERSFNLKDALKVWYPLRAKRPSDRPNSNFISISAASDRETGAEITDESDMKHGAFTKVLLNVYRENSAGLPLSEVLKKITNEMKEQGYYQTPTYHFDAGRMKTNLVGTNSADISNEISATCIAAKNGKITINKGAYAGIAAGNVLKDVSIAGNKRIVIEKIYDDSATAIDRSRSIGTGDKLVVVDHYTKSKPIIKLFIPSMNCTPAGFHNFFNSKIKQIVDEEDYGDLMFPNPAERSVITLYYDEKNFNQLNRTLGASIRGTQNNYVFLPVPSYILNGFKTILAKDQNLELVNKPEDADFVLYLNYVKARKDQSPGFVFYFHPRIDDPANNQMGIFSKEYFQTPSLNLPPKKLKELSQQFYEYSRRTIRYKTTNWINNDPRR